MTSLTVSELKMVFFALIFLGVFSAFMGLYSIQPVTTQTYGGNTSVTNGTTATQDTWISGLIGVLPSPFNDPIVLILISIILTPITIMLAYISIRAIKDLISQWV